MSSYYNQANVHETHFCIKILAMRILQILQLIDIADMF